MTAINEQSVGQGYARWFTRRIQGPVLRYLFSRRGLWVINTPYRRILASAQISSHDRVLDVGCGLGNILIALAQLKEFKHRLVGVDISPDLIELGRAELKRAGLSDRIVLEVGAATSLPFPSESFDVALASHVIKHLDDERLAVAFREVARVLRPGGRFLLWEFKLSPASAPLFWVARRTGVPPSFTLRSAATLESALLAAGFKQVEQVPSGFFLVPPVPRVALLAHR